VAISDEGDGHAPAVLCLHGIPGSRRDFRYLAPLLAPAFRIVRLEMPGFGDSPDGGRPSLSVWAASTLAVADALELEEFHLLAHSFGGGAALLAAAQARERVAGLTLVAGMGHRRHRAFVLPSAAYRVLGAWMAVPGLRSPLAAASRVIYRRIDLPAPAKGDVATPRRHVRLLGSVDFSALERAARVITARALLIHAEDDRLVEIAIARELATLLKHAELVVLESGGHHLNRTRVGDVASAIAARFAPGFAPHDAAIG
jgi:pimeloyl-ACP methyl ester carboxylesterase